MVIFHGYVNVYQRVWHKKVEELNWHELDMYVYIYIYIYYTLSNDIFGETLEIHSKSINGIYNREARGYINIYLYTYIMGWDSYTET